MTTENLQTETRLLHDSYNPEPGTGATAFPIFQSASFAYDTAEKMEDVFAGRDAGYLYSRINNPTLDQLERRLAGLEDGIACVLCASGMAAVSTAAMALAGAGDEIIAGSSIFGGTHSLFSNTLAHAGINTRFVKTTDTEAFRRAVTDRTRMIFVETMGNPKLDIPDLRGIAQIAKAHGIVFVVDNTAITPILCRPREWGANIVIHSTSKYLNGHGNAIGGAVIDCGTFDWNSERYAHLQEFYKRFRQFAFIAQLRQRTHRDLGCCLSPLHAFLTAMGLDTLALRMDRHCANAMRLAAYLDDDPRVRDVRYPGLKKHPEHKAATRLLDKGYGGLLTARLGSKQRCFSFINGLRRIRNVTNLGDTRTLIIHPASTFCREVNETDRKAMGVSDDMVRLSVGIEHIDDIIADIDQALNK